MEQVLSETIRIRVLAFDLENDQTVEAAFDGVFFIGHDCVCPGDIDENGVATVLIDRSDEKINTLGADLIRELDMIVTRLELDDVRAVVIGSAKREFLAGADIRVFENMQDPQQAIEDLTALHGVFDRIEALHAKAFWAEVDGVGSFHAASQQGVRLFM